MKKVLFLIILLIFFASSAKYAHASVLYSSPLNGSDSFANIWSVVSGDSGGLFSNNGLSGRAQYHYNIGTQQVVIKATVTITTGSVVSLRCRESFDRSTIEQATYQDQDSNATNITEGINGNYYGIATLTPQQLIGTHTFELDCLGNTITSKLDGVANSGIISPSYPSDTTYISIYASSGTTISDLVVCDATNCTYPPTSSDISLSVPPIKQYTSPWGSQTYDSANVWSASYSSITDWGCALTSATMILQYYGITKMPDGTPLDPGSVNAWLKSQPDGYVGNGLVNWLALPRLTKLAQLSGNDPNFLHDALVYNRISSTDTNTLATDLGNFQPDILEEPGHFVVATGTQSNTFTINDPSFPKTTLNDGYNNSFLTLGRYIPSHTDLSYIMLVGNNNLTFSLKDSNGNPMGEQFTQQPLQNDNHAGVFSGPPENILYLQQPNDGTYSLSISSSTNQNYSIQGFLYDQQGNVKSFTLTGIVDATHPNTYSIQSEKQNNQNDSLAKTVTFQSTLQDIQDEKSLGQIQSVIANVLTNLIQDVQKDVNQHHTLPAKLKLEAYLDVLKGFKGHGVSATAYDILSYDITYLKSHL